MACLESLWHPRLTIDEAAPGATRSCRREDPRIFGHGEPLCRRLDAVGESDGHEDGRQTFIGEFRTRRGEYVVATSTWRARRLREAARRERLPAPGEEWRGRGDGVAPLEAVLQVEAAGRRGARGYVDVTLFRGPL